MHQNTWADKASKSAKNFLWVRVLKLQDDVDDIKTICLNHLQLGSCKPSTGSNNFGLFNIGTNYKIIKDISFTFH